MIPEEVANDATRTAIAMIRAVAHDDEDAFQALWLGSKHTYATLLALASVPLSMTFAIAELTGQDPYANLDSTLRMLAQR